MTKIDFDSEYFYKEINPTLTDALENLTNAANYASNMSVPYDFYYRNTLRNLSSNIAGKKDKIVDFQDWYKESQSLYDALLEEHKTAIDEIDDSLVKERTKLS